MYVDILFPITKAISIRFDRVNTHCQTLKPGQAITQRLTIT